MTARDPCKTDLGKGWWFDGRLARASVGEASSGMSDGESVRDKGG